MPFVCRSSRLCAWEPESPDLDVTGHAVTGRADGSSVTFEVAHGFEIRSADDPEGGHLVRIRFEDAADERGFLASLEPDRKVAG
jgi:hypothetical protein